MATLNTGEAHGAFLATFRALAPHKHRYDVFRDFVTLSACSIHNGIRMDQTREDEYLHIIKSYDTADQHRFAELLGSLVTLLDPEPRDVLGSIYMDLEIASKGQGQFFSPPELSELMAHMVPCIALLDEGKPFITLSEPACGAGGMVLAYVKQLTTRGYDPMRRLWVEAVDIDRLAALMCYVQLSLWNVPAKVLVGDTLKLEFRECWYTPAHYLGNWDHRLSTEQGEAEQMPASAPDLPPTQLEPPAVQEVVDVHAITWKGITITISWKPNWQPNLVGHLEFWSENREPIPITETGYKSHFIHPDEIDAEGGPVAYVQAWLDHLDDGKATQLELF